MDLLPANSIIKHPQRFIDASEEWTSDIIPGVAYYCFQRMTNPGGPHPFKVLNTMTKRQQFYQDHTWMLDLGEQLPVHKGPIDVDVDPGTGQPYPLRWITPHGLAGRSTPPGATPSSSCGSNVAGPSSTSALLTPQLAACWITTV